jgi:hypothetical protein
LVAAADGDLRDIPLWPGGYLPGAIQEAALEFSPQCQVMIRQHPDGHSLLCASVLPEHRAGSRAILGEFLNYAFLTSARQMLTGSSDAS